MSYPRPQRPYPRLRLPDRPIKAGSAGTLEERIADLLERKRALADAVVADVADDEDSSL
ncbi:MAG: hypothetical protein ACRDZ4_00430 [Egibacteraceae bacterium]